MRTTVYRVENEEGIGPYQAGLYGWKDCSHDIYTGRPAPCEDPELSSTWLGLNHEERKNVRFGFSSTDQLCNWFSEEELDRLENLGFYVTQIGDETVIAESEYQVLYKVGDQS